MSKKNSEIQIEHLSKTNLPFKKFEKNIYSQSGQDGVLENLLSRIGPLENITCLEVGGWDGLFLSNICNLVREFNSNCIFIESNKKKYNQLLENHKLKIFQKKVFAFNSLLDSKKNTVGYFLKKAGFDQLDFLSIDVDGMDYFIFRDLDILPKVILIEFNPTFHPDVSFIQPEDPKVNIGSSSTAIAKLASKKGYSIVHYFKCDLLLVKDELIELLNLEKVPYQNITSNFYSYIGFGYNAEMFAIGSGSNNGPICPWESKIKISPKRFQVLPNFLQFFGDSSGSISFIKLRYILRNIYLGGIRKNILLIFKKIRNFINL